MGRFNPLWSISISRDASCYNKREFDDRVRAVPSGMKEWAYIIVST
jgi:hypothetical protein